MRKPSVKTLALVFGHDAKEARAIFDMPWAALKEHHAAQTRIKECYHHPKRYDVRMHVLDSLGHTCGLEGMESTSGEFADYLNTGDSYAPTVIFWRGQYRVQSVGDFVETMERQGVRFK